MFHLWAVTQFVSFLIKSFGRSVYVLSVLLAVKAAAIQSDLWHMFRNCESPQTTCTPVYISRLHRCWIINAMQIDEWMRARVCVCLGKIKNFSLRQFGSIKYWWVLVVPMSVEQAFVISITIYFISAALRLLVSVSFPSWFGFSVNFTFQKSFSFYAMQFNLSFLGRE